MHFSTLKTALKIEQKSKNTNIPIIVETAGRKMLKISALCGFFLGALQGMIVDFNLHRDNIFCSKFNALIKAVKRVSAASLGFGYLSLPLSCSPEN